MTEVKNTFPRDYRRVLLIRVWKYKKSLGLQNAMKSFWFYYYNTNNWTMGQGRVCSETSYHRNVYTRCVCVSCDLIGVTVDGGMLERGWGQRLISSVWDVPRLTLETLSINSKSIDLALLPELMITNVRYVRFVGTPHFASVSVLLIRTGLFLHSFLQSSIFI